MVVWFWVKLHGASWVGVSSWGPNSALLKKLSLDWDKWVMTLNSQPKFQQLGRIQIQNFTKSKVSNSNLPTILIGLFNWYQLENKKHSTNNNNEYETLWLLNLSQVLNREKYLIKISWLIGKDPRLSVKDSILSMPVN